MKNNINNLTFLALALIIVTLIAYFVAHPAEEETIDRLPMSVDLNKAEIYPISGLLEEIETTVQHNLRARDIYEVASETYNIPIDLLKAIEKLESGHYSSQLYLTKNNTWGCFRNGDWATFYSTDESTMELARTLRYSYFDNGLDTPELIAPVFCPSTPAEWAASIRSLMEV